MAVSPETSTRGAANWDMRSYFTAPDSPDFETFWRDLDTEIAALKTALEDVSQAEATSDASDATSPSGLIAAWAGFLARLESADRRMHHVEGYLGCMGSADALDERVEARIGALASLNAELEKLLVDVRSGLVALSDEVFAALLSHPEVAPIAYFVTRMQVRARVAMPAEQEGLAADLGVTGLSAWGRLYDRISGTLTFELAVPGQAPKTLPVSMMRSLTESPDPAVRKAALLGANRAWAGVADSVAACLNAIAGTRLTLYGRRGIAHYLDPALFDAGIKPATLDAMMAAVRARQSLPRRYLQRKAALLGRDQLGFQDLSAPLPALGAGSKGTGSPSAESAQIPWPEARTRVLAAFESYPALHTFAAHAFDRRWIDYEPRPGKRPGGFCSSSHEIGESRIFMTYQGAMGDVETLAHELGHGFHSWLMRDLRSWARRYPMTLAETASTFAEQLVTDAMLDAPDLDSAARARVLDSRLQQASAFLLNIPMRFDFECAFYEARQNGEVSVSQLRELMLAAQRRNYGDVLAPDEHDPWFWASKLHFYITDISFYNFPYTFGYLFSLGIFARVKAEGPGALGGYEALLRATGSAGAEKVARDALGVDLSDRAFWDASIDLIEADLQRFEQALDTIG